MEQKGEHPLSSDAKSRSGIKNASSKKDGAASPKDEGSHPFTNKESREKCQLEALIQALRALIPEKEKHGWFSHCAVFLKKFIKGLRTLGIDLFLFFVSLLIILAIFRELKNNRVIVEPFYVSKELEQLGYSSQTVANILAGKCNSIIHEANRDIEFQEFGLESGKTLSDLEVPLT